MNLSRCSTAALVSFMSEFMGANDVESLSSGAFASSEKPKKRSIDLHMQYIREIIKRRSSLAADGPSLEPAASPCGLLNSKMWAKSLPDLGAMKLSNTSPTAASRPPSPSRPDFAPGTTTFLRRNDVIVGIPAEQAESEDGDHVYIEIIQENYLSGSDIDIQHVTSTKESGPTMSTALSRRVSTLV